MCYQVTTADKTLNDIGFLGVFFFCFFVFFFGGGGGGAILFANTLTYFSCRLPSSAESGRWSACRESLSEHPHLYPGPEII